MRFQQPNCERHTFADHYGGLTTWEARWAFTRDHLAHKACAHLRDSADTWRPKAERRRLLKRARHFARLEQKAADRWLDALRAEQLRRAQLRDAERDALALELARQGQKDRV